MPKPIIGVTGRRSNGTLAVGRDARFTGVHFDSYPSDFARCIAAAGAIAVYLPFEAATDELVNRIDAIVISGGQDIHPNRWGGYRHVDERIAGDPRASFTAYDPERDTQEIELVHGALRTGIPLLGVCRGMQILNVALGGTLVPDLPSAEISHFSAASAPDDGSPAHEVSLVAGSLAHSVFGPRIVTNSWHHQAIADPGERLVISGWTGDGVPETIELPGRPVLGVQWHPEWRVIPDAAFAWLVRAAHERAASRRSSTAETVDRVHWMSGQAS